MKKLLCTALALVLALTAFSLPALAGDAEYPAVRIDPSTGKAWNLDGRTVYIYDWWSPNWSDADTDSFSEEQLATYNYRRWIEKTYNCRIVTGKDGDWSTITEIVADFAGNPDGSLRVYQLPTDYLSSVDLARVLADWRLSTSINLSASKWNSMVTRFMTIGGKLLGTLAGRSEPRQMLFFNKRVLEEAGIDWDTLYDMQKAGTWTFSAFENVLKQVHRDTDNDGEADIFGLTGNSDDYYRISVFANGGSFFDLDGKGSMKVTAGSKKSVQGLTWARDIWQKYSAPRPEDAQWDYYTDMWLQGNCAFYIGQGYEGFNGNSTMSGLKDAWGCVAFPKGPGGSGYVSIVNDNITVIPNAYDQDTLSKITLIYDLWTDPTPGYFSSDAWKNEYYNYTDARAVDETYAMLSKTDFSAIDYVMYFGSVNDIEGAYLLWYINGDEKIEVLIDEATPQWKEIIKKYDIINIINILYLPVSLKEIGENAFCGLSCQAVVIPYGCEKISAGAFRDCKELVYVEMPASVTSVAEDAFEGCNENLVIDRKEQ